MDVFELIRMARSRNSSDLSLVVGSPPLIRVYGVIQPIDDLPQVTADDVTQALGQLATDEERRVFQEKMDIDFSHVIEGVGRLRCNAAQQLSGISLAIRLLPPGVPTLDELGVPEIYKRLLQEKRGLILVCGPTGSGKSTTLAAMVHHLNVSGGHHIITIEDPIEYVHTSINSAITTRELGKHTKSYATALRYVYRQNPDVILVGEIGDFDTATAVLSVAETGYLVLSTSQAPSAAQAIERIVDMFPFQERHLSETRLASLIIAVICQTLVPKADGSGRIAAAEVMVVGSQVRNLIRADKINQLQDLLKTQKEAGMTTLDESLADLYDRGIITYEDALAACRDPEQLDRLTYSTRQTREIKA